MLTFLYCITHSISVFFTRISTWMNDRMEHKRLCKHIWKARKNLLTLKKDSTQAFILKTDSSSTELLEQIQSLFAQDETPTNETMNKKNASSPATCIQNLQEQLNTQDTKAPLLLTPCVPPENSFIITDIDLDDLLPTNTNIPVNRIINKSTHIPHS